MRICRLAASTAIATLALSGSALAASPEITVNGAGSAGVSAGASDAQQQAAYAQALDAAIADARAKALAVAQQLSLTLESVQSFTEQSNAYLGFCEGFFAPGVAQGTAAPTASSGPANLERVPAKSHSHHSRHSKRAARKADSEPACQVQADVTIAYNAS
jgi:hypothetical protein